MVCLWSLRSYTFIRNLTGGTYKTLCLLSSCDFSPDGALLATAAFSGSSWWIDLWDPYTAEKLATLAWVNSSAAFLVPTTTVNIRRRAERPDLTCSLFAVPLHVVIPAFLRPTYSDYFEDYGQNQISAIQFSPNGLHLAIVTDERWAVDQNEYV